MPTLEELLKQAARGARKPARRSAALWPIDDPALLPDMIQTGDYPDEARTIEEKIEAVYAAREKALWASLALPLEGRAPGPVPWSACLPWIWDPAGLLDGEHRDGWADSHWAFDFLPGPNGLQHRVNIGIHGFRSHGVPTSLLPPAPGERA